MQTMILEYLNQLYKDESLKDEIYPKLIELLDSCKKEIFSCKNLNNFKDSKDFNNSNDILLITYGNQFNSKDEKPLKTLKKFLDKWLGECISGIHILPFYHPQIFAIYQQIQRLLLVRS